MRARVSCSSAALFLLLAHLPFLGLPYFWDEAGQYVPASFDLFYSGALVAHSTVPNVHPPGLMFWLASVWHAAGYSIPATRLAMLAVALLACRWTWKLAVEFLCPDEAAAGLAVVLLCLSPLFFSQSTMVMLDMPSMALTALALLLFLRERLVLAALTCAALVMVKETGAILPAVFGIVLLRENRWKQATLFLFPAFPLAAWLLLLHARTGNWFGNSAFAGYNLGYLLNPARFGMAWFRRLYYLFIGSGYIIGSVALWATHSRFARSRAWRVAGWFAMAHVVAMCFVGGAVLERYLLPVLSLLLAAFANGVCLLSRPRRNIAMVAMCAASAACIVVNPLYPFPLENNLAWTDYVEAQRDAARYLATNLPAGAIVASSFPFAGCLRRPELGYTTRQFTIEETPDFTVASVESLRGRHIDALAIFSSTWDPLGLERNPQWLGFLHRVYGFEPDIATDRIPALTGLHRGARFERHGQWIEIFLR